MLISLNPDLDPRNLKVGQKIIANTDIPDSFEQTYEEKVTVDYETKYETTVTTSGGGGFEAALATTGVLLADDVSGVGVVDDLAIPFVLIGGLTYDLFATTTTTTTTVTQEEVRTVTNSPHPFWYVTYTKTNSEGEVYVGRSSGYASTPEQVVKRRNYNHHMDEKGFGKARLSTYLPATQPGGYATRYIDPSYYAIRGSEQIQIDQYRDLGISANTINGIGRTNKRLNEYLEHARRLLNH